jgi:hypothetical protein
MPQALPLDFEVSGCRTDIVQERLERSMEWR